MKLWNIFQLKTQNPKHKLQDITVVTHQKDITPFSFLNSCFDDFTHNVDDDEELSALLKF